MARRRTRARPPDRGRDHRTNTQHLACQPVVSLGIIPGVGQRHRYRHPPGGLAQQRGEVAMISAPAGRGPRRKNQMRSGMDRQRKLGQAFEDLGPPPVHLGLQAFPACLAGTLLASFLKVPADMVRIRTCSNSSARVAVLTEPYASPLLLTPCPFCELLRSSFRAVSRDRSSMASTTPGLT